jgi:subtilisin family serine protease
MLVVSAPDGAALSRVSGAKYVMSNLTVQWVDPTRVVEADFANPPFSGDDDFFFDLQWGHTAVKATDAWNAGVRGQGVRVAVLDGGFDLDHPDLAPNINYALSMDFTGEGLQYTLADTFSHGSHTAGTIGAADNAFGTIGVAPEAELVLVKVLGDAGSGSFADVISGIVHAADVNADIINMSLGATLTQNGGCDDTGCWTAREAAELKVAMQRAVTYAHQSGTLVIASAGNDGRDGDKDKATLHLPSDLAHVVSISATAPQGWALDPANAFLDFPASYTNYGRSVIDFAAPGGDFVLPGEDVCFVGGIAQLCWVLDLVFSTGNGGWYWSAGTSMAAPHAAGVAALILSEKGSLNPAQLEAFLRGYSADLGQPGNDPFYGAGRVQWAGSALSAP